MRERHPLQDKIKEWRSRVHEGDRIASLFPIEYILATKSIELVARLSRGAPEIASEESLASFVHWSDERKRIYAPGLLKLIMDYNSLLPPERKTLSRSEDTSYAQFCGVLDFSSGTAQYKSQTKATSSRTQTQTQTQTQNPSASQTTAKKRPAEETKATPKRPKRTALGEVSLNL